MNKEDDLHIPLHQLFEGVAMQLKAPEDACNEAVALINSQRAATVDELLGLLPEHERHPLEARMDTDLEHGLHVGKTDGFNDALDQVKATLLSYKLGSSQDSATPTAQGHEADNFNAGGAR